MQNEVDCPDHFFEMASMSEPQLLDFFADQRFASRATPDLKIAKNLCQYFIKEKNITDAQSFLALNHYSKMYEIAVHFGL